MRLSAPDYIKAMEKKGIFRGDKDVPEWNARVWDAYLALYDSHIGKASDIECIMTPEGAGFYRDNLAEAAHYSWALLGPVSHAPVPFTAERIVAMAPSIAEIFAQDGIGPFLIRTDTFDCGDMDAETARHFGWLNSPQAQIRETFEAYTSSLAGSRRKQMRRLFRDYDGAESDFRFELSARLPNAGEVDFIIANTAKRWGEDAAYALVQVLWPMAAGSVLPSCVRFMRVWRGNDLMLINSYMVRGDVIVAQSTCRNEDAQGQGLISGLGTMMDFKAIEFLCGGGGFERLDPTCRTGLDDPDSIGIAKREIINCDRLRPLLAIGDAGLMEGEGKGLMPVYDGHAGWVYNETPFIAGRGVL